MIFQPSSLGVSSPIYFPAKFLSSEPIFVAGPTAGGEDQWRFCFERPFEWWLADLNDFSSGCLVVIAEPTAFLPSGDGW